VRRVDDAQPGFLFAGRNMREVEAREDQAGQMAGLTWIGMLGVILVGTVVFGWYTRPRAAWTHTAALRMNKIVGRGGL
jgi:hypothetical protein